VPVIATTTLRAALSAAIASSTIPSTALASTLARSTVSTRLNRTPLGISSLDNPLLSRNSRKLFLRRCLNHNLIRLACYRRISTLLAGHTTSPPPSTTATPPAAAIGTRSAFANLFPIALAR
jgi:hypothetical protein